MCTRRALGKVKAEVEEFPPPSRDNHTGGPVGGGAQALDMTTLAMLL